MAEHQMSIRLCPWCCQEGILEHPGGDYFVRCANELCKIQPQTKLCNNSIDAIVAWNVQDNLFALECAADYGRYYDKELIPQLKKEIVELRAVLKWYANKKNWKTRKGEEGYWDQEFGVLGVRDMGRRARSILKKLGK